MCALRVCTSWSSKRLVLGLRCYTTLVDQPHAQSRPRPLKFDDSSAAGIQTLQEKENLYTQGDPHSKTEKSRVNVSTNVTSEHNSFGNAPIESSFNNGTQIEQDHLYLKRSSTTREELIEAALQDHDVELPNNVYKDIVSELCDNGDVDRALFWHRRLVARGDAPRSTQDIERLRQLLIGRQDWVAALEVKRSVVANNIEDGSWSLPPSQDDIDHKKVLQSFVSKLDKRVGVVKFHPSMEDHTSARFFATTFFSVEFIMEGMALFGITKLGSLSMQEIMKRTIQGHHCDSSVARQYFARMHKLGIECGTRYGRLLEYLAVQGKEVLLYSTVTSDFHPDMYDNLKLQKRLLRNQDPIIVERTRINLSFEMGRREVEIRNLLLQAGFESIDLMIADGIPITLRTRKALLNSLYIDRMPWISETSLRIVTRILLRLPHVTASEWRQIVICFMYIIRPHLRRDLEALLLSIRLPEIFDTRMVTNIIRHYLRLGSLGSRPSIETMLGGVRVLAALRDQGLALDIQESCEANLVSLFGDASIVERIDRRKRTVAMKLGKVEDFITAMKNIWGPGLWPGLSPPEIKDKIFAMAEELRLERQQLPGASLTPAPHTGAYNPGKVRHLQKQIHKMAGDIRDPSVE